MLGQCLRLYKNVIYVLTVDAFILTILSAILPYQMLGGACSIAKVVHYIMRDSFVKPDVIYFVNT